MTGFYEVASGPDRRPSILRARSDSLGSDGIGRLLRRRNSFLCAMRAVAVVDGFSRVHSTPVAGRTKIARLIDHNACDCRRLR